MNDHEHRFDLVLGPDGHAAMYGNMGGYLRRCKCGSYAPDYLEYRRQRAVHNHGPEEGPGLACKEQLVGECYLDMTLESQLERVLVDLRQILASQTENHRINADMMLAEQHATKALTHLTIYVAGIAI